MIHQSQGKIYFQIQQKPLSISEKEIAKLYDQSRFDPRLMEVLTEFIRDFWWLLNPEILNKFCKSAKYSFMVKASISAILEYSSLPETDKSDFLNWVEKSTRGIKDPNPQFLYIAVTPLFSKAAQRESNEALNCFKRHNLFAKDLPFNKSIPGTVRSERNLPPNKIHEIDLLKIKLCRKLKNWKHQLQLSNEQVTQQTGINRVFLSQILNNKIEHISIEYLAKHTILCG